MKSKNPTWLETVLSLTIYSLKIKDFPEQEFADKFTATLKQYSENYAWDEKVLKTLFETKFKEGNGYFMKENETI